ncbi:MAG: Smr/MutS family protein [bacterium]|nr:Smr/MutS family protein [bacterium]
MAYHEAELELKKALDDLYLRKCGRVKIVHGKGQGILKQMAREYAEKQPFVKKVYDAPFYAGGSGVTIVEFFPEND